MEMSKSRFLDRPVRRKWLLYVSGFLILVFLIAYGLLSWKMHVLKNDAKQAVMDQIRLRAETVAHTIAVTSRQDVLNANYKDLQTYFADVVGQRDISYIAVVNTQGVAVVHTDAKFRGKKLTGDTNVKADAAQEQITQTIESDKLYDVAVPVMGLTERAAVVRVGVSYAGTESMFNK